MCNLWDISADQEVCKVLIEFNSIDIFEKYIKYAHGVYPRAVEILIGILGNIAIVDKSICEKILNNQTLVKFFVEVLFYDLNDTQTTIQILRLFNTFFLNEENMREFLNSFEADTDFINFINYLLDQSLNQELLELLVEYIVNLFDVNETILKNFSSNPTFLESLLNSMMTSYNAAAKQSSEKDEPDDAEPISFEVLDSIYKNYFVCLQFLSTCEDGVKNLCTINRILLQIFAIYATKFLNYFDDTFASNIYFKNEIFIKNFECYFSVVNVVFANSSKSYLNLDSTDECLISYKSVLSDLIQVSIRFLKLTKSIENNDAVKFKFAFNLVQEFSSYLDDEENKFLNDQSNNLKVSLNGAKNKFE